jgi:hypothetical protein
MTAHQGSDGSATIVALTMLVLLAAAAAGGSLILQTAFVSTSRSFERDQLRHSLQEEGERMVGLIAADPTPDADSPADPIWGQITRPGIPDAHIFLQDVSSRLNANWVQEDIFEKTALGQLLSAGTTAQQLQQRREDKGISTDVASEYADLIAESALPRYFTGYGYANPNVTDEFALRKLYEVRMADREGAEVFHTRMQSALMRKKLLKRDDLRELLGLDYGRLFPLVNVEPVLNIHFVEPLILGELISLPELRIPRPREIAQALVDFRDSSEVTAERLRQIVGAPEDNRIYQYLGVVTWFWKLTVTRGSARLELIVARVPSADGGTPRFLIVEERYFP